MVHSSPITTHLITNSQYREHVYDPSEDTFLFLDALENDLNVLRACAPTITVDVGCGSGSLGVFLLKLMEKEPVKDATSPMTQFKPRYIPFIIGIDINPIACKAANETSHINLVSHYYDTIAGSLFSFLCDNIVDLFLFNPPYVATDSKDVTWTVGNLQAAWAGGTSGAEVIHRFIEVLPRCLSKTGYAYLLIENTNGLDAIQDHLRSVGLQCHIVLRRRRRNEVLMVLRCTWQMA